MSIVQRLPDTLISQIAAGEVIERPASVVKELVENAVDAGAHRIDVELEDGGLTKIVVSDDGSGMSPEDAALAIERHATSKLRTPEDLFRIRTLGFRGEALPSIASVSRFALITRAADADVATALEVEGGERKPAEQLGAPPGTRMIVRDLFFNQPARRKFQKSPATEQTHCVNAVLRIALACAGVRFVVRAKGRTLLDVPSGVDDRERIAAALGKELVTRLYPVELEQGGMKLSGFAADPEFQAGDARNLYLYVNGRYVRDRLLMRAVLEGYRTLLPHGRYPTAVLRLDVAGDDVDVNVHPQKFEVRFRDGDRVFSLIMRALGEVLARTPWLERGGGQLAFSGPAATHAVGVQQALARAQWAGLMGAPGSYAAPRPSESAEPVAPELLDLGYFSRLKVLSQYANLYILCEGAGELVVVDQHAAHERITFEKLITAWEQGRVPEQRLLFPLHLKARPEVMPLVEEHAAELLRMGLELAPFGDDTLALTAIPAVTSEKRARAFAEDAIAELEGASRSAGAELAHQLLARVACHSAVRGGDPLERAEMEALLRQLDQVDCAIRCPHGRPVVARIALESVGRWFERP